MSDAFGYDDFINKLNGIESEFDNKATSLLKKVTNTAVVETQMRTPVLSGSLKRSWTAGDVENNGDNLSCEMGSNIEYAEAVENGHKLKGGGYVKGNFMLRDALTKTKRTFKKQTDEITSELFR